MKIFSWVHRRFHHKDGFGRNVKKVESVAHETETQVLLEHGSQLVDVLDGWRDGVLTIGTFGFDSLSDFNDVKNQCPIVEKEESCDEEEEYAVDSELEHHDLENDTKLEYYVDEELNPLRFAELGRGFDEGSCSNYYYYEDALKADNLRNYELGFDSSSDLEDDKKKKKEKKKKKKERVTLADLFIAENSDVNTKLGQGKLVRLDSNDKPNLHAKKKGLSYAKKLIPPVGDDSRPIKKLHRLMRMMLKRKIHPDFEGNIQKSNGSQIKPTIPAGLLAGMEYGANESVSLVPNKVLKTEEIHKQTEPIHPRTRPD